MRNAQFLVLSSLLVLSLFVPVLAPGQAATQTPSTPAASTTTAPAQLPSLPKDPAEIFAAAEPLYDFSSPTLKPWHLKASYQLYDEKGQPSAQGTYEYWWASPGTYRSTWKRPALEHTDWHVDGKHYNSESGEALYSRTQCS